MALQKKGKDNETYNFPSFLPGRSYLVVVQGEKSQAESSYLVKEIKMGAQGGQESSNLI